MKYALFSLTLILNIFFLRASGADDASLESLEFQLIRFSEALRNAKSDTERLQFDDSLKTTVETILSTPASMQFPFSNVKWMGVLTSSDNLVRMYTWNIPNEDLSNTYRCYIQYVADKKKGEIKWVALDDVMSDNDNITQKYMTPEKWQGALYYEIIPVTNKGKTYYTLLGWDGRDAITNRKLIDILHFNGDKVRLGMPAFKVEKGSPKRHFLDYGEDSAVSLRYNDKQKRIIFDHLAPSHPSMVGNPAFYGPDLTFDAFLLVKGEWVYESNIEITLGKDDIKAPYIDPRK
ncbi:MAG: hypothetical protein GC193_12800 [Cryomorphaceae bacterium]|nr:hypothetical protein [Cryomorphaceae bacterium]